MSIIASPSTTISTTNLIISATAFVTTLTTLFPRSPRGPLVTILRLIHTTILVAPVIPSLFTLWTIIDNPTFTLASPQPTRSIFRILDAVASRYNATTGLTRHALTPDNGDLQSTPLIHVFVILISLISSFIIITRRKSIKPNTSIITFIMATTFILGTLLTTFNPGKLPLDTSLLENTWLDAAYKDLDNVNETRFLQNFWLRPENDDNRRINVVWVDHVENFPERFCQVFNALPVQSGLIADDETNAPFFGPTAVPTTSTEMTTSTITVQDENDETDTVPRPQDEDDRPQPKIRQTDQVPRLTRDLMSEILIVYTIGKPLFTTFGKSISLLALPYLTLTPIFISRAITSFILYPFIAAWFGILLILIIYATPETIRAIRAPFEHSGILTFCGRGYRVFVTDTVTHRVAVFDIVSFTFVGVTAILQGLRWLRKEREDDATLPQTSPVKMVEYEQVFTRSGSLRW